MSARQANELIERGLWQRLNGDEDGARASFEAAIAADPNDARPYQLLGRPVPTAQPPTEAVPEAWDFNAPVAPKVLEEPEAWEVIGPTAPPKIPRLVAVPKTAWDTPQAPSVHLAIAPSTGDAMDLVSASEPLPPPPPPPGPEEQAARKRKEDVKTLLRGAQDLLELDDHSGAMELIERAHQLDPEDPQIVQMRKRSAETLQAMFESKLGPLTGRPKVVLHDDEIIWLNLDHRAGFMLAQIDGTVSFDDLFAVSGMSRLDTARILAQLLEQGVIRIG
jgi:hypothetical protein